jgi:hypothetical protein
MPFKYLRSQRRCTAQVASIGGLLLISIRSNVRARLVACDGLAKTSVGKRVVPLHILYPALEEAQCERQAVGEDGRYEKKVRELTDLRMLATVKRCKVSSGASLTRASWWAQVTAKVTDRFRSRYFIVKLISRSRVSLQISGRWVMRRKARRRLKHTEPQVGLLQ